MSKLNKFNIFFKCMGSGCVSCVSVKSPRSPSHSSVTKSSLSSLPTTGWESKTARLFCETRDASRFLWFHFAKLARMRAWFFRKGHLLARHLGRRNFKHIYLDVMSFVVAAFGAWKLKKGVFIDVFVPRRTHPLPFSCSVTDAES